MGAIQTWCWWRLLISSLVSVGALAGGIGGASVAAAAIGIARVLATDWHARRAAAGVAQADAWASGCGPHCHGCQRLPLSWPRAV